jgi:hypothetical protein
VSAATTPPATPATRTARRLRLALLIAGSAVFVVLVRSIGVAAIGRDLAATGWWFGAVLAAWGAGYLLNTATLALLLGPDWARVGPTRLLGIMVAGFAMNYITPVVHMGGEPFRMLTLSEDVGGARAAFATISYKMLNAASALCYWMIGLGVFALGFAGVSRAAVLGVTFLGLMLIAAAVWIRRRRGGFFAWLEDLVSRWRLLRPLRGGLARHAPTLREIEGHLCDLYARPRVWLGALALETLARGVMGLEFFFILRALGHGASLVTSVCMDAASSFLLNALFFVPFELGVREGGLYLIAPALGLPASTGVFAALVNRLREMFWICIGLLWGHWLASSSPRQSGAAR